MSKSQQEIETNQASSTAAEKSGDHPNDSDEIRQIDTPAFDDATNQGQENGLFRSCMTSIRSTHIKGNKLRSALVVFGLFTDVNLYTHCLTMFYAVTCELEEKLALMKARGEELPLEEKDILDKLLTMGFLFTKGYERDLQVLYGMVDGARDSKNTIDWKKQVENVVNQTPIVYQYREHVRCMEKPSELAGAAFVLWGALIIGGGAMMQPKVKRLVGSDAVHVFETVIGTKEERLKRREHFIKTWDSLAPEGTETFKDIVESSKTCMQFNSDMMSDGCKSNPWWLKYVVLVVFVLFAFVLLALGKYFYSSASPEL